MSAKRIPPKVMWLVTASLLPAGAAGVYLFGPRSLLVIVLAVAAALGTEAVFQALTKNKITVSDGSACLTGVLVAYNLPAHVPFWLPVAGSVFAIAVAKQLSGGMGANLFNPALAGRVFLMAFWPRYMTAFTVPVSYTVLTQATPLTALKEGRDWTAFSYGDLFLGNKPGCIGEVCIAALAAGAAFLLWKRYISWRIPGFYIAAAAVITYVFGPKGFFTGDWLFQVLSGGLVLGAFFMATDYATSPSTRAGQIIFGAGCGLLTAGIRLWGRYPEGVSYAILTMNAATPLINRLTRNRK